MNGMKDAEAATILCLTRYNRRHTGDEPLLNPEDVNKLIAYFNNEEHDGSWLPHVEDKDNKNIVKIVTNDQNSFIFPDKYTS